MALKFGFLAVLYLFLLWVAWSALRDMRRGRGGVVSVDRERRRRTRPGCTRPIASPRSRMLDDEFEPRLLVERAAGHEPGIAYDLSGRRDARPRGRRDPARGSVRVVAPRADHAAGPHGRDRGSRLDERHLSQRRAAQRAAAAAPRRPDPDRRLASSPTCNSHAMLRAADTIVQDRHRPAAPRQRGLARSRARRCSSSPTGWAARRRARSPRGSRSKRSSRAARATADARGAARGRARRRPTAGSTSCSRARARARRDGHDADRGVPRRRQISRSRTSATAARTCSGTGS